MPEVIGCWHILDYITELGFVENNGFSPSPLSFSEIESWATLGKINLRIYEVQWIRSLSFSYLDQIKKSADPLCPPPFRPEAIMTPKKRKNVDSFFRNLVLKRKSK